MRNIDVKKWQEDYKGNKCFLLAILEMLLAIPIIIFTVYIFMALGLACLAWGTPANC